MNDEYQIIARAVKHEIKIKGSRFIGHVAVTSSREEAEDFVAAISRQHYDATHNCWAYRVGLDDESAFRYSDDGEPSGTAGKPIQDAIDGREITHVTCVVTRYYGGTKLGCGGLVRAYGGCAAEALDLAGIKKQYISQNVSVAYPYDLTGVVMHWVEKAQGQIISSDYSEETRQLVAMRASHVESFIRSVIEATAGRARVDVEGAK